MKKKIFVRAPCLSQSGYGEQARFALRALKSKEDIFDIYIEPINWGKTGWIWANDEFRNWMDSRIRETVHKMQTNTLTADISLQIGIPNEWQHIAPENIGYTAGIETTEVAPQWLIKGNEMDKILVVSEHAKKSFQDTVATNALPNGQPDPNGSNIKIETPITVVHERTDIEDITPQEIVNFNPSTDFNFLVVGQNGPRKNMENTVKWWLEEFIDQDVGLVVKMSSLNNSYMDSLKTYNDLRLMISQPEYKDRKCKVYLLHGDLTEGQMSWLYQHDKVKAYVNISHGEGFGLPIYEAAALGLPIITIGWSGQTDIIEHPQYSKLYTPVKFELNPIPAEAEWEGVLTKGTRWAYAEQGSYKMALRNVKNNWKEAKKDALKLQKLVQEKFAKERLYENFCNSIHKADDAYIEWMKSLDEADDL